MFMSVVLPQPDGPEIASISRLRRSRFTPRSAMTSTRSVLYILTRSRMEPKSSRIRSIPSLRPLADARAFLISVPGSCVSTEGGYCGDKVPGIGMLFVY